MPSSPRSKRPHRPRLQPIRSAAISALFAEQAGKDLTALAACMRADRKIFAPPGAGRRAQPVLVVCGEKDELTGAPGRLAAAFPNGRAVTVPGRDHMTTVGDKLYKQAVLDFLAEA